MVLEGWVTCVSHHFWQYFSDIITFYLWWKPNYSETANDLSPVTDKLYHFTICKLYRVHLAKGRNHNIRG